MKTLNDYASRVNRRLNEIPAVVAEDRFEIGEMPWLLSRSMRYSLEAGGKRLRPSMLLAAVEMLGGDTEDALDFACAVEMIHTYSLIHDDLPALDNDRLRRGQPTNHLVYGENMAILAGDGLLNLAYETMLSAPVCETDPAAALKAAREIACRAGVRGMIAGQTLDVKLEGSEPRKDNVRYIHLHKTADLLTAPVVAGLMLAGATEEQLEAGRTYGRGIGLAFQIIDDLLDIQGDVHRLGKETGMDEQRGKLTWPAVCGVEQSRKDALEAVSQAVRAMQIFGEKGSFLAELAQKSLVRSN